MRPRLRLFASLLILATCMAGPHVEAHPLDPALLELRRIVDGKDREQRTTSGRRHDSGTSTAAEQEPGTSADAQSPGTWSVLWRVPRGQPRQAPLEPVLPDTCAMHDRPLATVGAQHLTWQVTLDCTPADLAGAHIGVEGLDARETEVLVRVHRRDGEVIQAVLRTGDASFAVPGTPGRWQTILSYGRLGVQHILGGVDHLLFVLGLLFLVPGLRALLLTVTAFTLGHSITLSLAALGWLHVPQAPVELAIAFSIWWVAVRLAGPSRRRLGDHAAWPVAVAFGWLHGLGFAGALAETGLPPRHVPLALFAFNAGIEIGQVAFIAVVLGLVAVATRAWTTDGDGAPLRDRLALPTAYLIGSLAGYWMLDRAWRWLGPLG